MAILTEQEFNDIVTTCKVYIDQNQFPDLGEYSLPNVDFDTLQSIFSQIYIRHTKKLTSEVERDIHTIAKHYETGTSLLAIARSYRFSSYKLAKLYVKHILHQKDNFNLISRLLNNEVQLMKATTTDTNNTKNSCSATAASTAASDRLKSDLIQCCLADTFSSQTSDCIKHCVGKEFEDMLYDLMRKKNMCFETESELRLQGKPKTPDVLLMVPLAVCLPCPRSLRRQAADLHLSLPHTDTDTATITATITDGSVGGAGADGGGIEKGSTVPAGDVSVVHWIDSKAMFGDQDTFLEQREQLQGYVNRYGKGLVIYWHGFVETLPALSDDIVFADRGVDFSCLIDSLPSGIEPGTCQPHLCCDISIFQD